jgi:hypothetical protein
VRSFPYCSASRGPAQRSPLEFSTLNEARDDASRALGQMIKEAMPDGQHHDMAVEVRGADKRPLFKVQITFDVEPLAEHAFPAPL